MGEELVFPQSEFLAQFQSICHSFGLYGSIVSHLPTPIQGGNQNKAYLVVGRSPEIEEFPSQNGFDPAYYLRRNLRDERVVYTDYFIHELGPDCTYMDIMEKLLEYCKFTEFLTSLYKHFRMEPPLRLRRFEIRQLMDARDRQQSELSDRIWRRSTEFLNRFFEKERKGGIQKEWMAFFRSEKYPDEGNALEKIAAFRNRHSPVVPLAQLMACNSRIHTLEMQEHEYQRFAEIMSKQFSFVPYAVSDKVILDNHTASAGSSFDESSFQEISGEAFDKIIEDRFAEESWDCIRSYLPCYFEIRKVSYAAADEPYITSAFQSATLRYARSDDLQAVEARGGSFRLFNIPKEDFMNFVSLAKANELSFFIDAMGYFETPSLKKVSVIYSSTDEALLQGILTRIVGEKVEASHLIPDDERQSLQILLTKADTPMIRDTNPALLEQTEHELR